MTSSWGIVFFALSLLLLPLGYILWAKQPSKWSLEHNGSAYFPDWKKAPKCTGGTITGQKTLSCGTHHKTLTSLHRQLSTITCCDRFDRKYREQRTSNSHRAELIENTLIVGPVWKAALKSICTILESSPLSNALIPGYECTFPNVHWGARLCFFCNKEATTPNLT